MESGMLFLIAFLSLIFQKSMPEAYTLHYFFVYLRCATTKTHTLR